MVGVPPEYMDAVRRGSFSGSLDGSTWLARRLGRVAWRRDQLDVPMA